MKQYKVTGMSCAACSARVEKAITGLDGVSSCSVNLLTGTMMVNGDVSPETVVDAVNAAGYGATLQTNEKSPQNDDMDATTERETAAIAHRLIASLVLLIPLMYLTMGHLMWGWYLPKKLSGNFLALALIELLLTTAIMVINQRFFVSGLKGVLHGAPNMDTLVSLGAGASYGYSVWILFSDDRDKQSDRSTSPAWSVF